MRRRVGISCAVAPQYRVTRKLMFNSLRQALAEIDRLTPFRHPFVSSTRGRIIDRRRWWVAPLCAPLLLTLCKVHAQTPEPASADAGNIADIAPCLADGSGFLRARLKGAIEAELDWGNADTECTGAVRPTDGGLRVRFTHAFGENGTKLVLVFGIANLSEGATASALPVNVTVIREGSGEFYSTQGDDKCTLDRIVQRPLIGIPHRSRKYRVEARGFCTEPARSLQDKGALLISRFDFAGVINFDEADNEEESPLVPPAASSPTHDKATPR